MEINIKLNFNKPVKRKGAVVNKVLYALLEQVNHGTGLASDKEGGVVIVQQIQVKHENLVAKTNESWTYLQVIERASDE